MTKDQIVDIIPPSNTFPLSIKTSFGSTISSLTKEESYEKKHNKVETFLKNWKNKRNNKTNRNNKFNNQNICQKRITYSSRSSNSSICSSSISEILDHNIPSNNNSINSSTTILSNDSNSKSSSISKSSPVVTPKWKLRTPNKSRLNLYTQTNQTKRILTFDRTITPKRKILTPNKPRIITTKQDALTAFGF